MSSNLNYSCMTMNNSIYLPCFLWKCLFVNLCWFCIFWLKNHISLLLRNLNWNGIWLTHFHNYMWHPHPPFNMAAITWIEQHFYIKFRGKIENQFSECRFLVILLLLCIWMFVISVWCLFKFACRYCYFIWFLFSLIRG